MKNSKPFVFILAGVTVAAVLFLSAFGAHAKDKVIELRFASNYGPLQERGPAVSVWIEKLKKETGGRLVIRPYWSGTLLNPKEGLPELIAGGSDIAIINPHYFRDTWPLSLSMMPFLHGCPNSEIAKRVTLDVMKTFPKVTEELGIVKVLILTRFHDYNLMLKKPVRRLDDLRGLQVRVPSVFANGFKLAGGTPIVLPVVEISTSLEKGIIQGAMGCLDTLKSFRFAELVKYVTYTNIALLPNFGLIMNWDSYNGLPPDIRKIFDDSLEFLDSESEKTLFSQADEAIAFAKEMGVEFINLPPEDLEKLYACFKGDAVETAQRLDAKGLPGTELYNEVQRLIKEHSK